MERIRKTVQRKTIRFDTTDSYKTLQGTTMQYIAIHYIRKQYNTEEYNKCDAIRYGTHYTTLRNKQINTKLYGRMESHETSITTR